MKHPLPLRQFSAALLIGLLCSLAACARASDPDPLQAGLKAIEGQLNVKIAANTTTEADLAPELKKLDALLVENKGAAPDAASDVLEVKIEIYDALLDDPARAITVLQQLKADYPATARAKEYDATLKQLSDDLEKGKIARALKPGTMFPAFAVKDLDGKPLALAGLNGHVVLMDFWATWCVPCLGEIPNLTATYQKYHDRGFAVVGVSLDRIEAKDTLMAMIKDKNMPWPEYFDGKWFDNQLATQYGVHEIPSNYLLDGTGRIIGKNLRGPALAAAVEAALAVAK